MERLLALLGLCLLTVQVLSDDGTAGCIYKCGNIVVPYPFYLDAASGTPPAPPPPCSSRNGGRHLPLSCDSNSTLQLHLPSGPYRVLRFIASNLIIVDPDGCRSTNFSLGNTTSYALSYGNLLMFSGCSNKTSCFSNCNFNSRTVHWPYAAKSSCGTSPQCCYDLQFANVQALSSIDIGGLNCTGFSSLVTTFTEKGDQVTVEAKEGLALEWSLKGRCATRKSYCADNARCVNGTVHGHTCTCEAGFEGDAYRTGCISDVNRTRKTARTSVMFAGILGGATVVAGVLIAFALVTRRRRIRRHLLNLRSMREAKQLAKLLSHSGSANATLFTYKELERATKDFSPDQMLGHGGHGTVYRGKLSDGREVAVKRINHMSSHGIQQVLNEVRVLLNVSHPNLVRLLGCCLEVYDPLLVYEFVPNGTLAEHLQRERGEGLEWYTRISIATEAAQALAYLHTRSPPIYHRDVKSTNILLDFDFNTKVGDFGLSRLVLNTEGSHISTAPQGTPGYLDPEYHQNFQLSDKSDVYSFGVVLVEIISSLKVVDFSRNKREINLAALAVGKIATDSLDDIIDPILQINRNPAVRCMIQRVAELAFRCLAHEKEARPSMVEVLDELESMKNACLMSPGDLSPIRDIKIDESLLIPR